MFVCGLTLALSSCTIVQNVTPYRSSDIQEICIIEDPAVRAGFLRAYKRALREKGYKIRILEEHANLDDCELTSTTWEGGNGIWHCTWPLPKSRYLEMGD